MTGSGSAVYGIFPGSAQASEVFRVFRKEKAFRFSLVSRARYRAMWWRTLEEHITAKVWPPETEKSNESRPATTIHGQRQSSAVARDRPGLNTTLGACTVRQFADGEIHLQIQENVRGADVFVIQPTCKPVERNLMELLLMMQALKLASAERITAVLPYYGYARQDRKDKPRVPISAKLVAGLLESAGADRVLTLDLHAAQIQGFFDIPVDHLYASPVLIEYFRAQNLPDVTVVSPDAGGVERARRSPSG